jgi:hypothetical protein
MNANQYWQGQSVELRVLFVNADGVPLAAGGVAWRVKKPDGSLVTVAASADPARLNEFVGLLVADQAGVWQVKASCQTPAPAVEQSSFTVMASLPG